jgi:hypothetical protein
MFKLQDKPSALKREHPVLKRMKFIDFFYVSGSFLLSWIRIHSNGLNNHNVDHKNYNPT